MTDSNGNMYMPVVPQGYGNGGFGFGGDNAWWIIILLIFMGGWGNGWNGNGNGGGAGGMYPWLNQSNQINDGFRDQMINGNVNEIRSGVNGIQTQLCGGFAGVTSAVTGAQNAITQQMYADQIANMQQNFALQSQMAQCCCDNRAATADLKYTVATENCADRTTSMQNTRDIIDAVNGSKQAIIDKLCALELDGVKGQLAAAQRENVGLQNQLNMAALRESTTAQNAFIAQGLNNEVDALYNRLNNCPVPTTPVYGRTPIFTCGQNGFGGCPCGAA